MRLLHQIAGWLIAMVILLLKRTCRVRIHDDPRPGLRERGRPYTYAILHGHQVATLITAEAGAGAMVSRSVDAELIVPSLKVSGLRAVRGSTRLHGEDKGGRRALDELIVHVRGGRPAYLTVDGPRGPRGHVSRGIARLALTTAADVLVAAYVPSRRWVLTGAWDRFQIPKPFARIEVYFDVVEIRAGESVETVQQRVGRALAEIEARHDPAEAALGLEAAARRRARLAREAEPAEQG